MPWYTKLIGAITIFFLLPAVLILVRPSGTAVYAATWMGMGNGTELDSVVKDPKKMNSPAYVNDLFIRGNILAPSCAILPWKGPDFCSNDDAIVMEKLKTSGLGNIAMGINAMYTNPPADLAYWIWDTGKTLGFITPSAYAQGVGFTGLAPLLPLWRAARNIAYLLLAIAMIVVGFMVMLRKKIDPKTVMTVQNSLPRIVIALILITFSYAIVGFLIDLMYIVITLIVITMRTNLPGPQQAVPINFTTGGLSSFMRAIFLPLMNFNPANHIVDDVLTGQVGQVFTDFFKGLVFGWTIGNPLGPGPLFLGILSIAYFFAFIRILFMLLGCYTQIILAVLTGPLQILADVFPGTNGFASWLKGLAANLVAFPIVIFLLMLAIGISQSFGSGFLWTPPMLARPIGTPDLNFPTGLTELLISLGMVLMIPKVVSGAKEAFKTKPLLGFGGGGGGGLASATTLLSTFYYAQAMTPQVVKDRLSSMFGGSPAGGAHKPPGK